MSRALLLLTICLLMVAGACQFSPSEDTDIAPPHEYQLERRQGQRQLQHPSHENRADDDQHAHTDEVLSVV